MKLSVGTQKHFLVKLPRTFFVFTVFFSSFLCCAFLISPKKEKTPIDRYYLNELKKLKNEIEIFKTLCQKKTSITGLKNQFIKTRGSYKKIAVLIEFFNPYETKYLNGPALNREEDDVPGIIIPPHGFQLIEEYLFKNWNVKTYDLLAKELSYTLDIVTKLENETDLISKFKNEYIFEAMRSSVIRLITLGITGFDSPIAQLSISEGRETVSGIELLLGFYKSAIIKKDEKFYTEIENLITRTKKYLSVNTSFNTFNRLAFITKFANPLFEFIVKTRDELQINIPAGKRPLNANTSSIFAADAFDINFFSPDEQYKITFDRTALGKRLFNDPILSQTKSRSCASCHNPALAFTDGLIVPAGIDGKTLLKRNTPTLWNSAFQTRQFYDSRTDMLENQLEEVVHNADEMKGSLKQSIEDLKGDVTYTSLFKKAYSNEPKSITGYTIANAISSYVRTLIALNSRFDQYMQGNTKALSANEMEGFNLFAGKAKCATCHFIPLFNGLVPPQFDETESEVIGVPKSKIDKSRIDDDLGKYNFTKALVHQHAFKIPTLRNITLTAPYMHNGVYKTLEEVINFYNKGGGKGLGIAPKNQSLPFDKLNLTKSEIKKIISFLHTLTDTTNTRIR